MSDNLLTRLEQATEGSRELDVLIWAHADDRDVRHEERGCVIMYLAKSRQPPHDECVLGLADPGEHQLNFSPQPCKPDWPHYTTSLDAALTLVPEGFGWGVESADADKASAHICRLTTRGTRAKTATREWPKIAYATTPALALCIAALRARG